MTAQHDADRQLHAFLLEGPAEMGASLAARIRGDVHETKQRAGFRPWRTFSMPRTIRIVAPLAAIVVVIGAVLVATTGGPSPKPSATPGATIVPSVAPTPTIAATAYPLAPGEAWIAIGNTTNVTLVRSDGSGSHQVLGIAGLGISDPAWSPDGNTLAFEGNGPRGSQVWLADADGTNLRQLTPTPAGCPNSDCVEGVNPAWSPDGTRIAYTSPAHSGGIFTKSSLMVIDVVTGATEEIYGTDTATLGRPSWSPDGQSIALEVDRYVGAAESSALKDTAIGIIDLTGADHAPRMITDPALLAGYPVWHPTLDLIVFRTNRLNNNTGLMLDPAAASDVYTIKSDGTGLTRITNNKVSGVVVRAPSWIPDGRILFTARATTGEETLRVIDADGTNEASATGTAVTQGQGRWRPGT